MATIFQRIFGRPDVDTSYQDFQVQEAERARAEEAQRQARIDEGMKRIAAVFDGGTYTPPAAGIVAPGMLRPGTGTGAKGQNPRNTNDGWQPGGMFGGNIAGPSQAAAGVTAAANAPYEGMNPLLAQREKAQMDFYLPQLDNQRDDATKELTFALARAGLLNSSAAGERQARLGQDFALERGGVLSRIASDIAGQRTRLNQQRASIESGLRASGDQTGAANQALSTMATFAQDQPVMNPLGHLFAGVSEGIGSAQRGAEAERIRRTYGADPLTTRAGRVVNA
jgi:hypothetical protein